MNGLNASQMVKTRVKAKGSKHKLNGQNASYFQLASLARPGLIRVQTYTNFPKNLKRKMETLKIGTLFDFFLQRVFKSRRVGVPELACLT